MPSSRRFYLVLGIYRLYSDRPTNASYDYFHVMGLRVQRRFGLLQYPLPLQKKDGQTNFLKLSRGRLKHFLSSAPPSTTYFLSSAPPGRRLTSTAERERQTRGCFPPAQPPFLSAERSAMIGELWGCEPIYWPEEGLLWVVTAAFCVPLCVCVCVCVCALVRVSV